MYLQLETYLLSDTVDWQKVFSFRKQINHGIIEMCIIRVEEEVDLSTVGRIRLKKKYIKLMGMVTLL
jgi:hypothetical protein